MASQMQRLTLRIILKTMFNVDDMKQIDILGTAFNTVINQAPHRFFWLRGPLANLVGRTAKDQDEQFTNGRTTLDTFVSTLLQQRRSHPQDQGDMLSMLLAASDEGESLSDQQIRDQVMTLMAAGHETAQNSLCWTFYLLAQHPRVYEKLLGGGPRICIGMPFAQMEVRLLLATILQQYYPQIAPHPHVVPLPRVTLRPRDGMHMILQPVA